MAASSPDSLARVAVVAMIAPLAQGCSVGVGDGEVTGTLSAPECNLEGEAIEVKPDFFVADPVEEILEIRVQKGSGFEDTSDGVAVTVLDANQLKEQLDGTAEGAGVTVDLGGPPEERLVAMSLYYNRTCEVQNDRQPVVYGARSGTITFFSIYAPQVSSGQKQIHAEFSGVELDDAANPGERNATIDGFFDFLFNRGRPAQRFP